MALEVISSRDAVRHGRSDQARWPMSPDQQARRLRPIARPAFQPSFRIERGDRLFTVGSCFARNIERQLSIEGYDVAADGFALPGPAPGGIGAASDVLNKFNCHTILQEFRWAFGEAQAPAADGFHELAPGRWSDPQLVPTLRPAPLEEVAARRAALEAYFALAAGARVVVLTLGLAEAWFDRQAGLFLNGMVHKTMLEREPDRFELHLLDYNEIVASLEEIRALLRRRGRPDLKMLVTVSPVALGTSFAGADAMVGNAYSKAVQRAAVEAFVRAHDDVDYFPSYESVTLSDRTRAWREDQAHVSDELVRLNVLAMMSAYCPEASAGKAEAAVVAFGLLQDARAARAGGRLEESAAGFARALELAPGEGLIALEHGEVLLELGKAPEAVQAFQDALRQGAAAYGAEERLARALRRAGRHAEAHDAALRALAREPTAPGVLRFCSVTAEKLGRLEDARAFAVQALEGARQMRHSKLEVFEQRCRDLAGAGASKPSEGAA